MNTKKVNISPLRQRMIDDMTVRKFSSTTKIDYIRSVKKLAAFLNKSPENATREDIRLFLLHLNNTSVSDSSMNSILTALRFLFQTTLDCDDVIKKFKNVRVPRKLPVILNRDEVTRLINVAKPKYQAAFSVAYGAGLRISEVVALKTNDIDSDRMCIVVHQGKGRKDRNALLSPALLECLRDWWRYAITRHKILRGGWLFPGTNPINPMSTRQLARVCSAAAKDAKIDKTVSMHLLRHTFATHLLEQKVDIRVIQVLLGHSKLETTSLYTQVATDLLREVISPLDAVKFNKKKK